MKCIVLNAQKILLEGPEVRKTKQIMLWEAKILFVDNDRLSREGELKHRGICIGGYRMIRRPVERDGVTFVRGDRVALNNKLA